MPSFQEILIVGHVGRDCDLKYTPQGVAVASFSIAVSKKLGKGDDAREVTTWFNCTMWREKAENLTPYIKKGHALMVWGEASVDAYIANDGKPAASLKVMVNRIQFLEKKEQESEPTATEESADIPF